MCTNTVISEFEFKFIQGFEERSSQYIAVCIQYACASFEKQQRN